jgi:hypothetical protein
MAYLTIDRRILRIKDINKWMKVRLFSLLLNSEKPSCYIHAGDVKNKLKTELDQECIDQIATSGIKDLIRAVLPRFSDVQTLAILKTENMCDIIYDLPKERIASIYTTILDDAFPMNDYTVSSIAHAVGVETLTQKYWDNKQVKKYLLQDGDTEPDVKDVLALELLTMGESTPNIFNHLRIMYKAGKLDIKRKEG